MLSGASLAVAIALTPGSRSAALVVQFDDAGVVLGAQQRFRVEHAGQVEVVGVLDLAGHLLTSVDPGTTRPDFRIAHGQSSLYRSAAASRISSAAARTASTGLT